LRNNPSAARAEIFGVRALLTYARKTFWRSDDLLNASPAHYFVGDREDIESAHLDSSE
jgi:hypothetical protein